MRDTQNGPWPSPSTTPTRLGASQQRTHVILFSTDLALPADKIVQMYALRFQKGALPV